jgi:4-alpha-glucanotransferase
MSLDAELRGCVRDGLHLLGVRRLLLGIHDAAFPGAAHEDVGRGSPCSEGAGALLDLVRALGFDGIQLGPQGITSATNPSPYDATFFSRSPLSLSLAPLTRAEGGRLLSRETLDALAAGRPGPTGRVAYAYALDAAARAVAEVCATFRRQRVEGGDPVVAGLAATLARFRAENATWLVPDALYLALERARGGAHFSRWGGREGALDAALWAPPPGGEDAARTRRDALVARHAEAIEDHALVQLLLAEQHAEFRRRAAALGLSLLADLQVGMSAADAWAARGLVLHDWLMGAPPSRTNREGQAWNYPVLDPRRYFERDGAGVPHDGPALRLFRARVRRAFAEFDGVRLDHPHGLVCPWVYRAGPDPDRAVRDGARLFESPDIPGLAELAIARADQIDVAASRQADGRVTGLDDAQVDRYAALLDVVLEAARERGRGPEDVPCEVLSTMPYPLGRVLARHGLGRFRVTQKADLTRAEDVYRGENARPEDWILLGNHDTPPIWSTAERWIARGSGRARAEHLASRLLAPEEDRERFVRSVAGDARALAQASFAELLVGPARNVLVYFTDLIGARESYNRPGTVSPSNWSLRFPRDPASAYAERSAAGRALDVPRAVARALRSRGHAFVRTHHALVDRLESGARR